MVLQSRRSITTTMWFAYVLNTDGCPTYQEGVGYSEIGEGNGLGASRFSWVLALNWERNFGQLFTV